MDSYINQYKAHSVLRQTDLFLNGKDEKILYLILITNTYYDMKKGSLNLLHVQYIAQHCNDIAYTNIWI